MDCSWQLGGHRARSVQLGPTSSRDMCDDEASVASMNSGTWEAADLKTATLKVCSVLHGATLVARDECQRCHTQGCNCLSRLVGRALISQASAARIDVRWYLEVLRVVM